jgi:hypothetical protein
MFLYTKVGRTSTCAKTCNSQDKMSATWRKVRSTVETNEIMKTASHLSESWCWRQLLFLLSHVLMLVLTQLVCGRPKALRLHKSDYAHEISRFWDWVLPLLAQRVGKKKFDWSGIVWFKIFQNIGDRKEEHTPYLTYEGRSTIVWTLLPCSCHGRKLWALTLLFKSLFLTMTLTNVSRFCTYMGRQNEILIHTTLLNFTPRLNLSVIHLNNIIELGHNRCLVLTKVRRRGPSTRWERNVTA